ncbi:MAG: NADH:flavin oxidoreductase [Bacteroidia bacterium]
MKSLQDQVQFKNGVTMKNRSMLAPLTNLQSHEDGTLSDDEYHWLTKRAEGGFGMVTTCASHVSKIGQGFRGQLGIYNDFHIEGHKRLATGIKKHGSLGIVQLHHAGMRSPKELIGQAPECPSDNKEFGAKAMTTERVSIVIKDFIDAAKRAQFCGYDGVQLHGAHGYILAQFLSAEINQRTDDYGGSFENRCRIFFEIIDGIRANCGNAFLLGVRLSPERFGLELSEVKQLTQDLIDSDKIDFLDISVWDYTKVPEDEAFQSKTLMMHFLELDRKNVVLSIAGKIKDGTDVSNVINAGADLACMGRSGILHYDFPKQVKDNPNFRRTNTPVTESYLKEQGLGPAFVDYMKKWKYFVAE